MKDKSNSIINALKSKFAKSIMLPLISIFAVVLGVIIYIVFHSFTSEIKFNAIDKKIQQLVNAEENISERISEVNSIFINVSNDSQFSFVPLSGKGNSSSNMVKSLQQLLVGNKFISYLSYYRLAEEDRIYSSKGNMLFHTFWNSYINLVDETEVEYLDNIKIQKNRKVFPSKKSVDGQFYVTIIYPMPLLSNRPSAYVIAQINKKNIDNIVSASYTDSIRGFFIYDLDKVEIYHYGNAIKDTIKQKILEEESLFQEEKSYDSIKIEEEEYILLRHESSLNQWNYVSVHKKSDVTGNLTTKQISFLLILIAIMFLAIIAILALVLFNYRFINTLAHTISKDMNMNIYEEMDEQSLLSNAFLSLMEKTQNTIQNLFFTNLIAGQYDEETIESAMNEYNITFEYLEYVACVIYFHNPENLKINDEMVLYIKEYFDRNKMDCYPICQSNPTRMLIIINGQEEIREWERIDSLLSDLYYSIAEEYKQCISIGVGKSYSNIHKVYDSSHEAQSAMYFCILEGGRFIKRYEEINLEVISSNITDMLSRVIVHVRSGNEEEMHKGMKELIAVITAHGLSEQHQNFIAYNLLWTLKDYVDDPQIYEEINGLFADLLKRTHIKHLNIFHKIEKLCVIITEHRNKAKNKNKTTSLVEQILEVINGNLYDSMMSLESISDKCGISPSYLSRIFKSKVGSTPMYYVENLRMEKVKEKLAMSNDSLKQILIDTGYIDQSNFIRKFKKIEGVTPMTYRKLCQENEELNQTSQ